MGIEYHRWPFLPVTILNVEQAAAWWQDCFVPLPAMGTWQKNSAAAAVLGSPGSGKSTAVAWMERTSPAETLVVRYDVDQWLRIKQLGLARHSDTLLGQILTIASFEIMRQLEEQPGRAAAVDQNPLVAEFLTWLFDKHLERRTVLRFRHRLSQSLDKRDPLFDDAESLYPAYTGATLSELIETVRFLGFTQLMILIDLNEYWADKHLGDLVTLFSAIPFMEQQGLVVRAALPQSSLEKGNLLACSGGRLQAANLYYDETTCRSIIQRHLQVATEGTIESLEVLAERPVLQRAKQEIADSYSTQTIGGWLHWAQTLLAIFDGKPISDPDEAAYQYYLRHVPLRLAPDRRGVWRGPKFILVDERPFDLLQTLFVLRGKPSPEELIRTANNNSQYLNTLASRLRKTLEPLAERQIYIHNSRAQGYWLENYVI